MPTTGFDINLSNFYNRFNKPTNTLSTYVFFCLVSVDLCSVKLSNIWWANYLKSKNCYDSSYSNAESIN